MIDRTMTGVHSVIQIPFDPQGRIDEEDLRREVEWAIEAGAGAEREFHRIEGVLRTTEIFGLGLFARMYREMLVRRGVFKCAYARGVAESLDAHQIGELERQMEMAGLTSR